VSIDTPVASRPVTCKPSTPRRRTAPTAADLLPSYQQREPPHEGGLCSPAPGGYN